MAEYAWARLGGEPRCEAFKVKCRTDFSQGWRAVYLKFKADEPDKIDGGWYKLNNTHDKGKDSLWRLLKRADDQNFVIGAYMYASEHEHKRDDGLVEGHQ